nr:exodeoxyribonuclease III [Beutenbergia cavernae]
MLSVATVNVNGIRAAYRRGMGEWLAKREPDVLLLQELRAPDETVHQLLGEGWHIAHAASDAKGRAGVAVASRLPVTAVRIGLGDGVTDEAIDTGRWIEADVQLPAGDTVTTASLYLHSATVGTPSLAAKYAYLERVTTRMGDLASRGGFAVVAGDVNVAHRELDIRNWKGNLRSAGFLPEERGYLDRWFADGWVDVARAQAGEVDGPYTWWSWRGKAFDNDAGWRIDYQIATSDLAARAVEAVVDRASSYAERFSDHAPLAVAYDL